MGWILAAAASALFAGLTSILAKVGIAHTDSDVATAVRTLVVLAFSWVMAAIAVPDLPAALAAISPRSYLFLALSGLATGASWICYFAALAQGDVNKVVPIDKSSTALSAIFAIVLFGETSHLAVKLVAIAVILAGTYLMVEKRAAASSAAASAAGEGTAKGGAPATAAPAGEATFGESPRAEAAPADAASAGKVPVGESSRAEGAPAAAAPAGKVPVGESSRAEGATAGAASAADPEKAPAAARAAATTAPASRRWLALAILAAVFAALTSVLAKVGVEGVNSSLATALRTCVVLVMSWGIVAGRGKLALARSIAPRELGFICASGLATGASWLFYYYAIQVGQVSVVVQIDKLSILVSVAFARAVFGERLTPRAALGLALIVAATLAMTIWA